MGGIIHCHSTPIQFKTPLVPNLERWLVGWLIVDGLYFAMCTATQYTVCIILSQFIGSLLEVDKGQKTTIPDTLTV